MPWPLLLIAWLGWAATIPAIAWISQSSKGTTLRTATGWAAAACLAFGHSLLTLQFPQFPETYRQQCFYWAAIMALCPLIAVLGAQRPGVRVWNAFVLVPLVAVLGWPAIAVWFTASPPAPLVLETPAIVGIAIVAVMGLGNYVLIPRWTVSVLLYGAAIALTVLPLSNLVELSLHWRLAPYPCLGLAVLAGWLGSRGRQPSADALQQQWDDFRDRFGLVWAARIRERVNATAEKERWNKRLELQGFVPCASQGALSEADTRARAEHTLNWLLRRFVEDARQGPSPTEIGSEATR
jgi:hypothetical protein